MENKKFLYDVAQCKDLRGNDMRMLLFCIGRDVYPQQIVQELGWLKQNVSATAKRLHDMGLLKINKYPVYYRTNTSWRYSGIPGQVHINKVLKQ